MASDTRTPETHTLYVDEAALVYCFDFSDEPAVTGGATISSPTISVDSPFVTVAGAAVITQDFQELDKNGNVGDSVPANMGVKVAVTPTAKGQTMVRCVVSASDGSSPAKTVNFKVK